MTNRRPFAIGETVWCFNFRRNRWRLSKVRGYYTLCVVGITIPVIRVGTYIYPLHSLGGSNSPVRSAT